MVSLSLVRRLQQTLVVLVGSDVVVSNQCVTLECFPGCYRLITIRLAEKGHRVPLRDNTMVLVPQRPRNLYPMIDRMQRPVSPSMQTVANVKYNFHWLGAFDGVERSWSIFLLEFEASGRVLKDQSDRAPIVVF